MTLAAVIITKDRPREVARCLEALAAQERPPDEIVVVDASGTDAARVLVGAFAQEHPGLRVIPIDAPANICGQRNTGLERCTAEIVAFIDDDAFLPREYCRVVLDRFDADREGRVHGIAGLPEQARTDGWPLRAFRKLFLMQTDRGHHRFRLSGIPDFATRFDTETEVEFLASTAVFFRRSAIGEHRFDADGLTGTALGLATGRGVAEDVVFSHAVGTGGRLLVLPFLHFVHEESPAARENAFVSQALYVWAMRTVSITHANTAIRRAARLWALFGMGLLCVALTIMQRNAGHLRGYFRAMTVRLRRFR